MQPHPAPFSVPILDRIRELMREERRARVLDPFGGTGRVLDALPPKSAVTIIDIEPSYIQEGVMRYGDASARKHFERNPVGLDEHISMVHSHGVKSDWYSGDSRTVLRSIRRTYTHIITSPTYGNRFTDPYRSKPGTVCQSYAQSVGGALQSGNTGKFSFGAQQYEDINVSVMGWATKRLGDGGECIVNVSDFYKTIVKGGLPQRVPVVRWWVELMFELGLSLKSVTPVKTRRFKKGENRHRIEYESILVFEKGEFYDGPSTRSTLPRRSR